MQSSAGCTNLELVYFGILACLTNGETLLVKDVLYKLRSLEKKSPPRQKKRMSAKHQVIDFTYEDVDDWIIVRWNI